ncbi:hypothetical protein [Alteromonas facilis]|uniref:hypothetical protein n=1 Tax=Alteromonas facilis TaxID=2048004 RepID=UPI000C2957F1|nr:hypothetical protein [Alteromonas facilis]
MPFFTRRRPKQAKKPVNWRAVFAESGFISVSILLAFALQDWDEASDIEERTLIALCNVKSELKLNKVLLQNDYIPRQKGLSATVNGTISQLESMPGQQTPDTNLEAMYQQKSLRYSAWALAGESGYLLHANFELATEIGALIHFQQDNYANVVTKLNAAIFERSTDYTADPLAYYVSLSGLIDEWITQTNYLEQMYSSLFARKDFIELPCD